MRLSGGNGCPRGCILIFGVIGAITQIFLGVLAVEKHLVAAVEAVCPRCLREPIYIPLASHVDILVGEASHYAAGTTPFGHITIDM